MEKSPLQMVIEEGIREYEKRRGYKPDSLILNPQMAKTFFIRMRDVPPTYCGLRVVIDSEACSTPSLG
jgi:hypothetical protein